MKLIGFIGLSNSGKTTVIEQLVKELKRRGYRVAVLKHCPHGFELDKKGTDSARIWAAGADGVGLVSPEKVAVLQRIPTSSLRQVAALYFPDYDFVLIEGGKDEVGIRKIAIVKEQQAQEIMISQGELLAVVSDKPLEIEKPFFRFHQIAELADFIEQNKDISQSQVILSVEGRPLPLKPFVQEIIAGAVWGMVKTLKKLPGRPRWLTLFLSEKNDEKS